MEQKENFHDQNLILSLVLNTVSSIKVISKFMTFYSKNLNESNILDLLNIFNEHDLT